MTVPTTIPVELIKAIFEELVPTAPQKSQELSASGTLWPQFEYKKYIALSHASRTFRDIALDNPRLWSSIHLRMHPDAVKAFLLRSKDAGLSIFISREIFKEPLVAKITSKRAFKRELRAFMKIVTPVSHRWELLACEIPGWSSATWLFRRGEHLDLSSLAHVFIRLSSVFSSYESDASDENMEPWDSYTLNWKLPSLVTLDLLDVFPGRKAVTGDHVKSIVLNKKSFSRTDHIVDMDFAKKLLLSLKTLRLDQEELYSTIVLNCLDTDTADSLIFSNLRTLQTSIHALGPEIEYNFKDWQFFILCRFPQLQQLDIRIDGHHSPEFSHVLSLMPTLKVLRLESTDENFQLEELINKNTVPALRSLEIHTSILHSHVHGDVWARTRDWADILPNDLRALSFHYCDLTALDPAAVAGLLTAFLFRTSDAGTEDSADIMMHFRGCKGFTEGHLKLWGVQGRAEFNYTNC